MDFYKLQLLLIMTSFLAHARARGRCSIDVGFLIDDSATVGQDSFNKYMIKFVKKAAGKYHFSRGDGVQAGLIKFGEKSRVEIKFNSCQTRKCFLKQVNALNYEEGEFTRMDAALKHANDQLFQTWNGYRGGGPEHPAYIILVTDGGQNPWDNPAYKNKEVAAKEAEKLKNKGIKIIVLGLIIEDTQPSWRGHEYLISQRIASPNLYWRVGSEKKLLQYVENVTTSSCHETCVDDMYRVKTVKADIGFLIDSSKRAENYFDRERKIVNLIVKAFKIKLGGHQAGLISYGSTVNKKIEPGAYKTVEKFNKEVSDLKMEGEKPRLDTALESAYSLFTSSKKRDKLLFVLTDGSFSTDTEANDAFEQVKLLKELGVRPFFIAMGDRPTIFPYLDLFAGLHSKIQQVNVQADLMEARRVILEEVCRAPHCPCKVVIKT